TVTKNSDGTTTISWNIDKLNAKSQSNIIEYSIRPSLIFTEDVRNNAVLDFSDANNNDYPSLNAFTTTPLSHIIPTRNPQPVTFWLHHKEFWTPETLARIQATDDRFDGADGSKPDGVLSQSEIGATPANAKLRQALTLVLLGTYFNLATGRISADVSIIPHAGLPDGVKNVKEAVEFAINLLLLPDSANSLDYPKVINALRLINSNINEGASQKNP